MKRNERLMLEEIGWAVTDGGKLTEWEGKFVHSMHRSAVTDEDLTDNQRAALTRVWERVYKRDGQSQMP